FVLGALLCVGLALLGYFVSGGIVRIRALDRTVEVKGLSEREVPADIAIWPIRFNEADNDLNLLFLTLERKNAAIEAFLKKRGFKEDEISVSAPAIQDRQAQGYSDTQIKFRYSGASTLTVYTRNVDSVRNAMKDLVELGKQGIAIAGQDYEAKTEYLFTRLNDIKPDMVEEATKNARLVAEKFARDSQSGLGKIKRAVQGQFSINDRDSNTPHIKKVRVVSTLEYYLAD
ncbi:MAG: SIMPL domain-containing protein, partial [Desulfobacterales bacterium]|nr:SIMPL domain-containing protein [Desulfobacterales bacterium]